MKLHKSPQSTARQSNMNEEEDDREFRDFVESISVSKEELAAIVSTLETLECSSIHEGDDCLQEDKGKHPRKTKALIALREFQRRFKHGWEGVASAFVAPGAPEYRSRSPRKT